MGEGFVALEAARTAAEGGTLEQVVAKAKTIIPNAGVVALLENISYAVKGGRLSSAAVKVGGFLKIQPLIRVHDNKVSLIGQARRRSKGIETLIERAVDEAKEDPVHLTVHYAEDEQEGHSLLDTLKARLNCVESYLTRVPVELGVHAGPGARSGLLCRAGDHGISAATRATGDTGQGSHSLPLARSITTPFREPDRGHQGKKSATARRGGDPDGAYPRAARTGSEPGPGSALGRRNRAPRHLRGCGAIGKSLGQARLSLTGRRNAAGMGLDVGGLELCAWAGFDASPTSGKDRYRQTDPSHQAGLERPGRRQISDPTRFRGAAQAVKRQQAERRKPVRTRVEVTVPQSGKRHAVQVGFELLGWSGAKPFQRILHGQPPATGEQPRDLGCE